MSKKKVVFFTNSLGCGGAERVISRLAPELEKIYDFSIILLDSSENYYDCHSTIISLGGKEKSNRLVYGLNLIKQGLKFGHIVKDREVDIVISFLPIPDILNIIFNRSAKKVINIRGDLSQDLAYGFSSKLKHFIKQKIYNKADAAIVLSAITERELRKEYGFNNPIFKIFNPFEIELIEKECTSQIEASEQSSIGTYNVVLMGRLDIQKGFLFFIRSISKLASSCDIRAIIIGKGDQRQILQEEIDRLGLNHKIKMIGAKENPFMYISKADLFVMSSISEGFPNSLVEAMSCGVPVISTDCMTGPREILYENPDINRKAVKIEYADFGILVPCFDKADSSINEDRYTIMANAIEEMINNNELRQKYIIKAKERAKQFTIQKSVQGYKECIDSLLK